MVKKSLSKGSDLTKKLSPDSGNKRILPLPRFVAAVLLAGLAVLLALFFFLGKLRYTPPPMKVEDIVFPPNTVTIGGEDSPLINILLIGQDRRITEGRQRSDVMLLCSFNPDTQQVTITSFLRDLFVEIPGHGKCRLNEAYRLGGMDLLNETIAFNFGVLIDGDVEVDFSHFMKIIDEIGGVTVDVTATEAKEINWMLDIDTIHEGEQTLTGIQALAYSRTRRIDSDFGRTGRQRKLLTALYHRVQELELTELLAVASKILPDVSTNLSFLEIADYSAQLLPMVKTFRLAALQIPVQDGFMERDVDGSWVLIPDMEQNRQALVETLTGEGSD